MDDKKIGKNCGTVISDISKWTTLVFLTLRACDIIDWAWYWVLSPSLIAIVLGILGLALAGAAATKDDE